MTDAFTLWLRSLDPKLVALESFYHASHREMLREHEARKQALKSGASHEYAFAPRRKTARSYTFTQKQLEIASRVAGVDS